MKAMAYIKQNACADLSLKEFQEQWSSMTPAEQEELRQWARAEGKVVGVEVE